MLWASLSITRRLLWSTRPGNVRSHLPRAWCCVQPPARRAGRGGGSGHCSDCSLRRRWLTSATTAERSATRLCAITAAVCQARLASRVVAERKVEQPVAELDVLDPV